MSESFFYRSITVLQVLKSILFTLIVLLLTAISGWFFLLFLLLPFILFKREGISFSYKDQQLRQFQQLFKRSGKWIPFSQMDAIAVISRSGKKKLHHVYSSTSMEASRHVYDVFVRTKSKKRIFVQSFKKKSRAIEFADLLSKNMGLRFQER